MRQSLKDRHRPIVGGLEIQYETGLNGRNRWICTLGLVVDRNSTRGLLTNSHCSETQGSVDNATYFQPCHFTWSTDPVAALLAPCQASPTSGGAFENSTNAVAREVVDPPLTTGGLCPAGRRCRFSDANFAVVNDETTATRGRTALIAPSGDPTWDGTTFYRVVDGFDTFVNELATKTGRTTGRTSGPITHLCVDFNVVNTNITMICNHAARAGVDFGDSGSPVTRIKNGAGINDVGWLGLVWGQFDLNGDRHFAYSGLNAIQTELGALQYCAVGFTCP